MNTKNILHRLFQYLIFTVIFIISTALTAGVVAYFASLITDNEETIVIICLTCIWLVMLALYILRSRYLYKKRIIKIDKSDDISYANETKRLKTKYILSILLSSIISGIILINLKPTIMSNIKGLDASEESVIINDTIILILKISVVALLCGFWIFRKLMKKKINLHTTANKCN